MRKILNVVWENLLPAFEESSLPARPDNVEQLNKKLQQLAISTVEGEESSPMATEVSGKKYTLEPNGASIQSISFNFETSPAEISITNDQGEQTFGASYQKNATGKLANPFVVSEKAAVSGAWEENDTYAVKIIYYETPQSVIYTFRFEEDKLYWNTRYIAAFAPRNQRQMIGIK